MDSSKSSNIKEVYLAKWLNGEISEEKLKTFISEEDIRVYIKIKNKLAYFEAPVFESDKLKQNIETRLGLKSKKNKTIKMRWYYAAAATLTIIVSTYFYNINKTVQYFTKTGEKQKIELLDGSEVNINANSKIVFSKKDWRNNRTVILKGEAFFKVMKGKKFTVETENGNVNVLGTKFNINSQHNFINVKCFSGKVSVIRNKDTIYLTRGQAYQFNGSKIENWDFSADKPAWFNNESTFKSTPLKIVIKSLENQFNIEIRSSEINEKQIFTGSFKYDNLDVALKSVFLPLGINYKIDNKIVFLSKK